MKNTTSTLSCSKLLAQSPMTMPSKPKMLDTATTQNRKAGMDSIWVAPNARPISKDAERR